MNTAHTLSLGKVIQLIVDDTAISGEVGRKFFSLTPWHLFFPTRVSAHEILNNEAYVQQPGLNVAVQ